MEVATLARDSHWLLAENEQRLCDAVAGSTSIAGTLRALGLQAVGGNYRSIKHHITRLGIDTSHHLGQAWSRDSYSTPSPESTKNVWKAHLIRTNGHQCWRCGLSSWLGSPIPLELEHKDGNRSNNDESNLELLCCNCHALTPTWRRRKTAEGTAPYPNGRGRRPKPVASVSSSLTGATLCIVCATPCAPHQYWHKKCSTCIDCGIFCTELRCRGCNNTRIKPEQYWVDWPPMPELRNRLVRSNYSKLGRELGVSDNALRKHLRTHAAA